MKKTTLIISLIAFYAIFSIVYFLFLAHTNLYFVFMIIGSVAVLSTGVVYSVIENLGSQDEREIESRIAVKPKSLKKAPKSIKREHPEIDIIEEYLEAYPSLIEYINSEKTHVEFEQIERLIFSVFGEEELSKIKLLGLKNLEIVEFIREMLYYEPQERETLLENMLKSRGKHSEDVYYTSPTNTLELSDAIRVYLMSLIEPGGKKKLCIVETNETIKQVREKAAELLNYNLDQFLLSSGGIILKDDLKIEDYDIEDEDEIVLIPPRKEKY